jgi:site-specific recombinase XerD
MKSSGTPAALLESFFTQRLMNQRQASPHTISSYRDTFRLLLQFAQQRLHKAPAKLAFEEIDAPLMAAFLDDLEKNRGIAIRSRGTLRVLRLTAIRSFFRYAAYEEPSRAAQIQRVLAIPGKRHTRTLVHFLDRPEIDALPAADQQAWLGRRDHALLLVAVQTGLRLSELTGLQRADVVLGRGAHVRCVGKGRKERCTPLAKTAVAVLKAWLREPPKHRTEVLFPTARGSRLSPDSVSDLLAKHVAVARKSCPSLRKKHVTPHVLRHSMAMGLLHAGVDRAVIALWLGHESVETTQIYLEANLAMQEQTSALQGMLDMHGQTAHSAKAVPPSDSQFVVARGHLRHYDRGENLKMAVAELEAITSAAPDYAPAQTALSEGYFRMYSATKRGEWRAKSDQAVRRAAEIDGSDPSISIMRGRILRATGETEAAVRELRAAVACNPGDEVALLQLAGAYESVKRFAEAESTYREANTAAAELFPGLYELRNFLYVAG